MLFPDSGAPKGRASSLPRLWPYVRPYRSRCVLAAVAILFTSGSVLAMGGALRYLVDQGFGSRQGNPLNEAYAILLGITLLLACATFTRYYMMAWLGERVAADIRRDLFSHLLKLDISFFETNRTGDLLSRLTTDIVLLQIVITSTLPIALRNILLLLGGFGLLMFTSPRLTAYVLLMLPLTVAPILLLGRRVRAASRATQAKVALLGAMSEEAISGIRTLQAMTMEAEEAGRFNGHVDEVLEAALKRVRLRSFLTGLVILLVFGSVMTVLWIGGYDVMQGRITVGELSAFVFYAVIVASSVGALAEATADVQRAAGAAERLSEILGITPATTGGSERPESSGAALSFEQVGFYYAARPHRAALEGIDFTVAPGEAVALVGPSGSGKTTLFQLLLRFYDPTSGTIRLNGTDIRTLDLSALRRHIGLVPQDPVIFTGDAWHNIRAGKADATDEEVLAAASAAHALEFLEKLPQGLATPLGQKGVRLSGGQKQRLAIARAIVRNPALLLLDEATSALDAESERFVQEALGALMKGRTTLVIAHRLSTVINADRILLLNEGRIEAAGTHSELMKTSPLYARLAALQWREG